MKEKEKYLYILYLFYNLHLETVNVFQPVNIQIPD